MRFWFMVLVGFFGVFTFVFVGDDAVASSYPNWFSDSISIIDQSPSLEMPAGSSSCAANMEIINVKGVGEAIDACVFGNHDSKRVARYINSDGVYIYAAAFPTDAYFMRIQGLCEAMARCLYSYTYDNFIYQDTYDDNKPRYAFISNFSKYLSVNRQNKNSPYYTFNYNQGLNYLKAGENNASVGVAGVSDNGKWAVVELTSYGFVRLNLRTFEFKRIAAHDSIPLKRKQQLEATISNDGVWFVITGFQVDTYIYENADICGDTLTTSSNQYFKDGTLVCSATILGFNNLFPGDFLIHNPKFNIDATRLTFQTLRNNEFQEVTLTPQLYELNRPFYLAFGDSFTSGEGETSDTYYTSETNTATNSCHVSKRSYPYLLGELWLKLTKNLACSGSRIDGVRVALSNYLNDPNGNWPTVVSLSIGGNDVDLMGKLQSCIGPSTCEWAKAGNRLSTAKEIKEFQPKLISLIKDLKTNLAPAPLFIVGYPSVINDQPSAFCSVIIDSLLDSQERKYMSESVKYINAILRAAANYSKVWFVDIDNAFSGERLCDQTETAMNAIRYGGDIAPIPMLPGTKIIGAESFHPTPRGHYLSSLIINSGLNGFWQMPNCYACQYNDNQTAISDYWLEGVNPTSPIVRQLNTFFLLAKRIIENIPVEFSFPPNTFQPGSNILLQLHSEMYDLGSFTSNDDGSLQGVITMPNNITGYHTIHSYGESYSGEEIDLYQTIFINDTDSQTALTANGEEANWGFMLDTNSNVILNVNTNTNSNINSNFNARIALDINSSANPVFNTSAGLEGSEVLSAATQNIKNKPNDDIKGNLPTENLTLESVPYYVWWLTLLLIAVVLIWRLFSNKKQKNA